MGKNRKNKMTVELNKDGLLKIKAETELESYALRKWLEDNKEIIENQKINKAIVICYGIEPPPIYRGQ